MTREEAKELLPIIQAFVEGKKIEYSTNGKDWSETEKPMFDNLFTYRIKPEHPKNVWHVADEVPPKDTNILIETSFFGEDSLEYYSYYWCYPAFPGWVEYVKEYHVKRWAYMSDLLPKGGEE